MSLNEFIILVLTIYVLIGSLSMFGVALADADWRCAICAFFCWPVIAYKGLLMAIERVRN